MADTNPPDLGKLFEEFAGLLSFSPEQEKNLNQNVRGAIVLNVMRRLFELLPEDQKKIFSGQKFKDAADIMAFLKKVFPEKTIQEEMAKSTERVVSELKKS